MKGKFDLVHMFGSVFTLCFFLSVQTINATITTAVPVLWIQQPAISPDGKWIAFEYKGNIYKVSSSGGNATALTLNDGYNGYPVWSHNGESISFASDRFGNFDVFIMPAEGGAAKRLTFDSARDIPYEFSQDNSKVYFGTERHDTAGSVRFPADNYFTRLFSVPAQGGRNLMVNSAGTEFVHFNENGTKFLFQDRKGYEDPWRKHHQSAITRDIWLYDTVLLRYSKISDFAGEDREPVWGKGDDFYYLSERNGTQNLFRSNLKSTSEITQLTFFSRDPVRFLSRSATGVIAFTQAGELYTIRDEKSSQKLSVFINAEFGSDQQELILSGGASEMAVSPNDKEIAYVLRGEIYVTSLNGQGTKKITNTSYREAMPYFSPDGRTLSYSVEKQGNWDIYTASIAKKNEPYFYAATAIEHKALIASSHDEFKGIYSPDGKSIAYLEDRNILKVLETQNKTVRVLLPAGNFFSYKDGDPAFSWSPDSKYLITVSAQGFEASKNAVLLSADGTLKKQLTQSGFTIKNINWSIDGKMLSYQSGKQGLKSLSLGPEQTDIYALYLDKQLFADYQLSKNEQDLDEKISKGYGAVDVSKEKSKAEESGIKKDLQLSDLENLEQQTLRLTMNSADISSFCISSDGEKIYYLARYENKFDLWMASPRTHDLKKLSALGVGGGELRIGADGRSLYLLASGSLFKIDAETGINTPIAINNKIVFDKQKEREEIYEHIVKQIPRKHFDPKMQDVDWDYYTNFYRQFLAHINNGYDFEVLLSELLGELNTSHTGSGYKAEVKDSEATAALGLLLSSGKSSEGLIVSAILANGPFDIQGSHLKVGDVIDRVDHIKLSDQTDISVLLNGKRAIRTLVDFHDPKTMRAYQQIVKPVSIQVENKLLYSRWTSRMEFLTDSLSNGELGYLHIQSMDEASFRITLDKVNGKYLKKKAVIIDTRFNRGGNLHDYLIDLFTKKTTLTYRPQGNVMSIGSPTDGSAKPSCVLVSEGNYSDSFNFPYIYKRLKVGKVIGTSIAGSGTGVNWEPQLDPSIVVGFPQTSLSWTGENTIMENNSLDPDIKVENTYSDLLNGRDAQLERAVKEMLDSLSR